MEAFPSSPMSFLGAVEGRNLPMFVGMRRYHEFMLREIIRARRREFKTDNRHGILAILRRDRIPTELNERITLVG